MIINKTSVSIGHIPEVIEEAIDYFLKYYRCQPVCSYDIILCADFESLQEEWRNYNSYGADVVLPLRYDGQFLVPWERTDKLVILASMDESVVAGAGQYLKEKRGGVGEASEERGLKLMHFFRFIEMLCHEFSHLCSYDRMMALTDWADPQMHANNYDYHLHDEFIARVRGTEIMLRMFAPYMENDLIYSMYMCYVNDTKTSFTRRLNEVREVIERERKGLEEELLMMQRLEGLTDAEMVAELEYELGHRLENGYVDGKLVLSDLEVIEYSAVDEFAELLKFYLYVVRNRYAVYEGTQFAGALVGFYAAFCGEESGWDMELENVIDEPFWQYLDESKIREQDEAFRHWLIDRIDEG